jgi:glyoxylase-like metal-dependent hydrolase (beta-lactamase superfamily II)
MKNLMNAGLMMMAISISGCATSPAKASGGKGRVIEFKSGTEGFDTRTFFYEGENEVIAFDAQFTPELAKASLKHLRTFTNKPVSWLVVTHPNPDKYNGASVFKAEGAKVIASQATAAAIPGVHAYKEYYFVEMAKMFKKGQYPQPAPVDQTFSGKMDLVLRGGEKIELRELSQPGVSQTQTVAYIPNVGALFVGDLIHHKAHAWLEGGIVNGKPTPTLAGWVRDLQELTIVYPARTTVYGGRGLQTDLKTGVIAQIQYLVKAEQLIRSEIQRLGPQSKEFLGANAPAMYKSLSAKFATAFPDYEYPYMIEYSAYGVVQRFL